ncbi:MAG: RNA polymerase factor sigma-54 [Kiritimatiellae bacterium]|nr:RNA polymerase factor sigma-54 [Kiritimatiellia bacterium]
MAQSMSMVQSQTLQQTMAPQLRQSLEILQIPMMELNTLIQQEVEINPTLEVQAPEDSIPEVDTSDEPTDLSSEMDLQDEFDVLAKIDGDLQDYFFQDSIYDKTDTARSSERQQFIMDSITSEETLHEHLLFQLDLSDITDEDKVMGEMLIGSINDDGYLTIELDELADSTGYNVVLLKDVLTIIQDFHPTGVGARNITECLHLQLEQAGKHENSVEWRIIDEHFNDLGRKKFTTIAESLKVSVETVKDAADLISRQNPKPGNIFAEDRIEYILPEVFVELDDNEYVVVMNEDSLPQLRISSYYRKLIQNPDTPKDTIKYIKEKLASSKFLITSIEQRQNTLKNISTVIVEEQQEFFRNGIKNLKPMTMQEVADKVGVHETTVSRAVSSKYMQTPNGIFELRYFFTTGLQTADGSSVSNESVKDMIANMIEDEDTSKPLSDQVIADILKGKGINVARRTVAKYRIKLKIPSSSMRRSD